MHFHSFCQLCSCVNGFGETLETNFLNYVKIKINIPRFFKDDFSSYLTLNVFLFFFQKSFLKNGKLGEKHVG